jgi:hypothetical protein
MIYEAGVKLPPGTLLKGCKLVVRGREAIVVDLEVRNTRSIVQPDGRPAQLSGVKFLYQPKNIDSLLEIFVVKSSEDHEAAQLSRT